MSIVVRGLNPPGSVIGGNHASEVIIGASELQGTPDRVSAGEKCANLFGLLGQFWGGGGGAV